MVAVKYSLEDFIQDMAALLEGGPDQRGIFDKGSSYLERLIRNPQAIPEEYQRPLGGGSRPRHGSYLLHRGDNGLLVTSVVWGPGDHIGPHDHHTWGMIGVIDNILTETRFRRLDDRTLDDYAVLERTRTAVSKPGEVSLLTPGVDEIHQIDNETDRPMVEIHVYGRELAKLYRCRFNIETRLITRFFSGKYDNE